METLNNLARSSDIPLLTAFLLGLLVAVSPCPLATNITAIAFISRDARTVRRPLIGGMAYTVGRSLSYVVLAALTYVGLASVNLSRLFQGWGDKVLGPFLVVIGLALLGVIHLPRAPGDRGAQRLGRWLAGKGHLGALALGMLFALAFCPYSGVMFFGLTRGATRTAGSAGSASPSFVSQRRNARAARKAMWQDVGESGLPASARLLLGKVRRSAASHDWKPRRWAGAMSAVVLTS